MIHYLENKVGVVDFANTQGLVKLLNFINRKGAGSLTMIQPRFHPIVDFFTFGRFSCRGISKDFSNLRFSLERERIEKITEDSLSQQAVSHIVKRKRNQGQKGRTALNPISYQDSNFTLFHDDAL